MLAFGSGAKGPRQMYGRSPPKPLTKGFRSENGVLSRRNQCIAAGRGANTRVMGSCYQGSAGTQVSQAVISAFGIAYAASPSEFTTLLRAPHDLGTSTVRQLL